MKMMNQVRRSILSIIVVLLLIVSTTVTNGKENATCETEVAAYTTCFQSNSCQCADATKNFNATKYNTTIADGNCASVLDASCEVQSCCPNCTALITTYFTCVFTSKFPTKTCVSNCEKKSYEVKGSNAIMTTATTFTTSTIIITIGSILMASLGL